MVAVKIAALMTAGRYENTYCRNVIECAIRESGLKLSISLGVFYGQCMQMMMEQVVKEGCDVILTIDGDSIFNATHIDRLVTTLVSHDEIDAIASMQARRGISYPLFTVGSAENRVVSVTPDEPFKVISAHFGLTAIKVPALMEIEKPWFASRASPDGSWGKESGKVDDDIWFWLQWHKANKTLYVDPGCRIGHMEEMVVYYDDDLKLQHTYPAEWHDMQRAIRGCTETVPEGERRLNIGGGKNPIPGYEIVDRCEGTEAFPLAFDDEVFDEVRASHILEHFPRKDVGEVVKEWCRVLKPGGTLKLAVPNYDWLLEHPDDKQYEAILMGGQIDENDFHKTLFNPERLRTIMIDAGLVEINKWFGAKVDSACLPCSLNLMGKKLK